MLEKCMPRRLYFKLQFFMGKDHKKTRKSVSWKKNNIGVLETIIFGL